MKAKQAERAARQALLDLVDAKIKGGKRLPSSVLMRESSALVIMCRSQVKTGIPTRNAMDISMVIPSTIPAGKVATSPPFI
uniref:Uncharacterized protein n=1 Tax=Hyaloperonospora arabidopsidis (strain Emoy2) TaxID=559515 RepID=M4C0S0_HYAAE